MEDLEDVEEMFEFARPDVENFFQTIKIENFEVDPYEKQLIFSTNINGSFNLWGMDLPQTFPYPLTFFDQSNKGIFFDPNGKFVIIAFDQDGDENDQIYVMPPRGGEVQPLLTKEGERFTPLALSKDGKKLYYVSTKDNPRFPKTYCYDLETKKERVIMEKEDRMTKLSELSPEGNSFVYKELCSNTSQRGYLVVEGEEIELIPDEKKGEPEEYKLGDCKFISENELFFLTNKGEDYSYLASFDIASRTGEIEKISEGEDFFALEFDEKYSGLYIGVDKGVECKLYYYDLQQKELLEIPLPVSTIEKIKLTPEGGVYLQGNSATSPSNIYRKGAGNEWEKITNAKVTGVEERMLVEPETITYESFDGLEIEALFFQANPEFSKGKIVLWLHGGPQDIERKSFRPIFQLLLHRGYSIFAPNFRGSDGYGASFRKMAEGDWGYGPRLDCVAGLDWLIDNGYCQKGELIAMGESYGGYMALLLHGKHPEYFQAIIDIFGPSDLFSFVDSGPDYVKAMMKKMVGDPQKDKKKFEQDSPINYTEKMTRPTLVIQGTNDPLVDKKESDQLVEAIKKAGNQDVEYLVIDDEGHGFSKRENEIKVYRRILDFLEKNVG